MKVSSPILHQLAHADTDAVDAGFASGGLATTVQARRRVRLVVAVLFVAVGIALGLTYLYYDLLGWPEPPRLEQTRFRLFGLLALSFPTFVLAGWRALSNERVLELGLGYQVAGALISSISYYGPDHPVFFDDFTGVTWLGVWILMFPLVAPAGIARNTAAALLSAATAPAVYFYCLEPGAELPPASVLTNTFVPNFFCALLALFPAVVVQQLARRAERAERTAQELGTYQLVERLGQGGMGEVWRANHKLLRRPAAIKRFRLQRGSGEQLTRALARFEREANATAQLKSPHTVTLYDFGTTPAGEAFCVMELLDGLDLEDFLKRFGPLDPRRALHVVDQICDSLCEAHHSGMVHRDLKPANVYLCRHGLRTDFVKVLDFGLVSFSQGQDVAKLTEAGTIMGTPLYLAPEQATDRARVGPATDLYALGCLTFALVTGRPPFHEGSAVQVLTAHVGESPPRLREVQPGLPAELEELIAACLEKDPARRPAGIKEFRARLRSVPLEPWTTTEADAWWAEHLPQTRPDGGPVDRTSPPTTEEG